MVVLASFGDVGRRKLAAVVTTTAPSCASRATLLKTALVKTATRKRPAAFAGDVLPFQRAMLVRLLFRFGLADAADGTLWPIGF
jgi:hypothetical protein